MVKAVQKIGQGRVKDEGKVWFGQLRDKRERYVTVLQTLFYYCFENRAQ